jgi:hypothetical protein
MKKYGVWYLSLSYVGFYQKLVFAWWDQVYLYINFKFFYEEENHVIS